MGGEKLQKKMCLIVVLACMVQGAMLHFSMDVLADVPLGAAPAWTTVGNYDSSDVALGDLDYDGDLDLASFGESNLHVYCNENGDLNATACWTSTDSSGASGRLLWADVDKDNYPELFTSLGMYENNNGVLSGTALWTNLSTVDVFTLGDVDGDTYPDLVTGKNDRIELYENDAGVIDDTPNWNTTEDSSPEALALGDVDHDGYLELAVGNTVKPIRIYDNVAGSLNNVSTWNSTLADYVGCLVWGDVNADTYPELYACTQTPLGEMPNRIYMNSAGTLETSPSWNSSSPSYATDAVFADLQGDGDLDLIVSNLPYFGGSGYVNGTEMVYLNEAGVIDETHDWNSAYQDVSYGLDVGKVDSDAYLDVVVANREDLMQTYPGRILMYNGLPPNRPPQITSVLLNPTGPRTEDEVTITVTASDPDSDTPTYDFSVAPGNGTIVSETGSSAVWKAPNQPGNYTVNITVSDGKGGFAYRDVLIVVVKLGTSEDGAPFFSLQNIWFLLILIIIVLIVIVAIAVGIARRKRKPLEEEVPPPPPPEDMG